MLTEGEQGLAPGAPIVEIGDPADLEGVVELPSADAVRVAPGADVRVTDWGRQPLPARVRRIDPSAVTRVSALGMEEPRVTALLALEGDAQDRAGLGDGWRVTARIRVGRGEGVLAVPVGALFRSGDDWAVFRVLEGRARVIPVTLGERGADHAVLVSGLEPGDVVVLHPGERAADAVRVGRSAT